MAWVGKYRITLTPFPRHKEITPSYFIHLEKQSMIPLYFVFSLEFSFYVWRSNFTRSIGAVAVLAIIPAKPPAKKSKKSKYPFFYVFDIWFLLCLLFRTKLLKNEKKYVILLYVKKDYIKSQEFWFISPMIFYISLLGTSLLPFFDDLSCAFTTKMHSLL